MCCGSQQPASLSLKLAATPPAERERQAFFGALEMPTDIRAFFDTYRDAFNRLDGEAIARQYAVPSGIASDSGYTHWPSFEPIRENMVALCSLYSAGGYVTARFEPTAFLAQGEAFAIADLQWHIDRSADQEPWVFNTTYNLIRTGAGWRVLLCTAYSEKKLNAHAAAP